MTSDQLLIEQLQNPKTRRKSFEVLVRQYSEALYWQIRRIVLNHDDADHKCFFDHVFTSLLCMCIPHGISSVAVAAAAVVIGALAGDVLHPLDPPRGIKHKLGKASVQVFPTEAQKVGVFVIVDGKLPAVAFPGSAVRDLHGHHVRYDFIEFLVHFDLPP